MTAGIFGPRPASRPLSYGGMVILVVVDYFAVRRHPSALWPVVIATAVGVVVWFLLLLTPYGTSRHSLIRFLFLIVMAASAIVLVLAAPDGGHIIPAALAIVAASRVERPAGTIFAVATIAAYLIAISIAIGVQPIALFSYGLGLTFAMLAARSTSQLYEEQARTKALLVELQQTRDAQVQAAALNERARIAREIHDVLAHTLAALAVQLEGARVMLHQRHSDPEAEASVERSLHLAKEGLDETRRAVAALRGDQIPGPSQLKQLVDSFQRDTGLATNLTVEGEPRELSPEAQLALYRTAQEALTNIRKHARPERVEVRIRYGTGSTELTVEDHGIAPDGQLPTTGYGLVGMRERAELAGGTLDARPTNDGFIVALRLPG
ncbi:MAG TPA: sensor histidine kinase [Candidatus Acidoferrum sp.]|nr:sensor histidine kinase [Candidatus Acidoferrum sp.]